jgi:hypothetical protein
MAPNNNDILQERRNKINEAIDIVENAIENQLDDKDYEAIKSGLEELNKSSDQDLMAITDQQLQENGIPDNILEFGSSNTASRETNVDNAADGGTNDKEGAKSGTSINGKKLASDTPLPSIEKEGLFVSETSDGESDEEDEDFDPPTVTRQAQSIGTRSVAWLSTRLGPAKQFINMYGKRSHARYRLEPFAATTEYEANPPKEDESCAENRPGEAKDGRVFRYNGRHAVEIHGVAFRSNGGAASRQDLEQINPDSKKPGSRYPHTYVRISWKIGDDTVRSWETRTTLRRCWGKDVADKGIYQAALQCENRYAEATGNDHIGGSRSPSVGFIQNFPNLHREPSEPVQSSPSKSAAPHRKGDFLDMKTMREFIENYALTFAYGTPAQIPVEERKVAIETWASQRGTPAMAF